MFVKARGFILHVTCLDLLKLKQCYKRCTQRFLRSFVLCYLCLFCSTFCGKFLKLSHHSNITFKLRKRFSAAVFRSFFNPSHVTNVNTYTCTFTCYAPKINTLSTLQKVDFIIIKFSSLSFMIYLQLGYVMLRCQLMLCGRGNSFNIISTLKLKVL